jgi:hypothetical protein
VVEVGILEAVEILKQRFLMQEGVAGVSYRQSDKLVIYVEDEETAARVPKNLLGYPVEVRVVGRIYTLSLPPGKEGRTLAGVLGSKTARWRPVPGGVSVGSVLITAGTMSGRVYEVGTGRRLMLSNRHVFWGPRGTKVVQPGVYDGGRDPGDVVGYVYRYIDIKPPPDTNLVDAALAEPVSDDVLSDEVLDVGVITDIEEAREGMTVCKSGRTTCYACNRVTDTNATIKVYGYPNMAYAIFEDQILTEFLGAPGDSGSICVNPQTKRAVGLLFAGSSVITVLNKITNVCRLLNVTFRPTAVPPQLPWWWSSVGLALGLAPVAVASVVVGTSELYKYVRVRR